MNNNRFKMSFDSVGYQQQPIQMQPSMLMRQAPPKHPARPKNLAPKQVPHQAPPNLAPKQVPHQAPPNLAQKQSVGLNTPMINRVHKAKPGCSACGKKVA